MIQKKRCKLIPTHVDTLSLRISLYFDVLNVCFCLLCVFLCAAVLEAVQSWRTEKESRLSGEKQEEEEEEESIYTVHHEEVNFTFQ